MSGSSSVSNDIQNAKGIGKETAGKIAGDKQTTTEGQIDQAASRAKNLVNNAASTAQDAAASAQQKLAGSNTASSHADSSASSGGLTGSISGTAAGILHTVTEQLHHLTTGETVSHSQPGTIGEEVGKLKNEALSAAGVAQAKAQELIGKGQQQAQQSVDSADAKVNKVDAESSSKQASAQGDADRATGQLKHTLHQAAGEFQGARAAGDASHASGKPATLAEQAGAVVGQVDQQLGGKSSSQTQGVYENVKGAVKGNAAEMKGDLKGAAQDVKSEAKQQEAKGY